MHIQRTPNTLPSEIKMLKGEYGGRKPGKILNPSSESLGTEVTKIPNHPKQSTLQLVMPK